MLIVGRLIATHWPAEKMAELLDQVHVSDTYVLYIVYKCYSGVQTPFFVFFVFFTFLAAKAGTEETRDNLEPSKLLRYENFYSNYVSSIVYLYVVYPGVIINSNLAEGRV